MILLRLCLCICTFQLARMNASRLTASLTRSGAFSRPAAAPRAARQLPCTCRAPQRMLATSSETTRVGEAATAAGTSTIGSIAGQSSNSSSSSSSGFAADSFRRQQSRPRPLPVIKVSSDRQASLAASRNGKAE